MTCGLFLEVDDVFFHSMAVYHIALSRRTAFSSTLDRHLVSRGELSGGPRIKLSATPQSSDRGV